MLEVMNYVEVDAPEQLTLVEWRRARLAACERRRSIRSLLLPARRRTTR